MKHQLEADDVGAPAARVDGHPGLAPWRLGSAVLIIAAVVAIGALTGGRSSRPSVASPSPFSPASPDVQNVVGALRNNAPDQLYPLLATNAIRGYSSRQAFNSNYHKHLASSGTVTFVAASGPARSRTAGIDAGVATLILRLGYGHRAPKRYQAYFIFERAAWRLWFTKPVR